MAELPFGEDVRTATLREMQRRLVAEFGPIAKRPSVQHDPLWVLVQGVIGARTRTPVSNATTERLLQRYGTWEAVAQASLEELAYELRYQTYPGQSAQRLKACLTTLIERRGSADLRHLSNLPTDEAMAWLETLPGVGRKISAGVMNVGTFNRRATVIDSHHKRVMQRMELVPPRADTRRAFDVLVAVVPPEWSAEVIDEHHLLVKKLGQTYCRPAEPKCRFCPMLDLCPTGRARTD